MHCGMALTQFNKTGYCTKWCENGGGYPNEGNKRLGMEGKPNHVGGGLNEIFIMWTPEELRLLEQSYYIKTKEELLAMFPERSWSKIYRKALILGLLGK